MIEFANRAKVEKSDISRRRIWESHCGRYRVVESRSVLCEGLFHFENRRDRRTGKTRQVRVKDSYADQIRAETRDEHGWRVLSNHKTRGRAEAACREHAEAISSQLSALSK